MTCNVDSLLLCAVVLEFEIMLDAILAAIVLGLIIQVHVVVASPSIAHIMDYLGELEASSVVFNRHEKDTITPFVCVSNLFLDTFWNVIPFVVPIAPVTLVLLVPPRVPHFDESDAFNFVGDAKNCVGMALGETVLELVPVTLATCPCQHDLIIRIMLTEHLPEFLNFTIILMSVIAMFPGAAVKSSDAHERVSTFEVPVVSMVLGESFLKDHTPDGVVLTNTCKDCLQWQDGVRVCQGEVVIHDDSLGDTEGVDVDTVQARSPDLVLVTVVEHVLNAMAFLGKGGGSGHQPAVADLSLADVFRVDTIRTEQGKLCGVEVRACSLPIVDPYGLFPIFSGVSPDERAFVSLESHISERVSCVVLALERVEVSICDFVHLRSIVTAMDYCSLYGGIGCKWCSLSDCH